MNMFKFKEHFAEYGVDLLNNPPHNFSNTI